MQRRAILIGGVAVAGAAAYALWPRATAAPDIPGALSVLDAAASSAAGEVLLVDIRRPEEWAATGIAEHAVPIDMRRRDFLTALTEARRGAQPVALICASGVRSRRLSTALHEAGITPVLDVPEGMLGSRAGPGWLRSGLPVRAYTP